MGRCFTTAFTLWAACLVGSAPAQIGGQTAADGPFMLDNVEDLDTTAGGVERKWLSDFVASAEEPLMAISPSLDGLALASGQSSNGCLRFTVPTAYGYLNKSFGVPMPAVKGASTLASPGNISSFTHLKFLARFTTTLPDQQFQVILETYPGSNYPKLYYKFTPASGPGFQEVSLDLRSPDFVQNAGSLTIDELLSQTRFLSFYFYGGPTLIPKTFVFHVDDIQLVDANAPPEAVTWLSDSQSIRIKADGGGYQELFYSYTTGAMSVSEYRDTDASLARTQLHEEWTGVYHYDYTSGGFTQAFYSLKSSL